MILLLNVCLLSFAAGTTPDVCNTSSWPAKNRVCGNCVASVKVGAGGSCEKYCKERGLECKTTWFGIDTRNKNDCKARNYYKVVLGCPFMATYDRDLVCDCSRKKRPPKIVSVCPDPDYPYLFRDSNTTGARYDTYLGDLCLPSKQVADFLTGPTFKYRSDYLISSINEDTFRCPVECRSYAPGYSYDFRTRRGGWCGGNRGICKAPESGKVELKGTQTCGDSIREYQSLADANCQAGNFCGMWTNCEACGDCRWCTRTENCKDCTRFGECKQCEPNFYLQWESFPICKPFNGSKAGGAECKANDECQNGKCKGGYCCLPGDLDSYYDTCVACSSIDGKCAQCSNVTYDRKMFFLENGECTLRLPPTTTTTVKMRFATTEAPSDVTPIVLGAVGFVFVLTFVVFCCRRMNARRLAPSSETQKGRNGFKPMKYDQNPSVAINSAHVAIKSPVQSKPPPAFSPTPSLPPPVSRASVPNHANEATQLLASGVISAQQFTWLVKASNKQTVACLKVLRSLNGSRASMPPHTFVEAINSVFRNFKAPTDYQQALDPTSSASAGFLPDDNAAPPAYDFNAVPSAPEK